MSKKKECILVADDAAIDRRVIKMLLRHDYDVDEAVDGSDALRQMEENPERYACLLLDMLMPVMDGFKVLAHLQEDHLLERVPVIALTAISDTEGHIKCYESGAIDLIEKPFDQEMLRYKIKFNISRFRRLRGTESISATVGTTPKAVANDPLREIRQYVQVNFGTNDEETHDMLGTFMESLGECVQDLRGLSSPPDMQVIRGVTHKMYGFAKTVGALELNDLSLLLNAAAKQNDQQACEAGIRAVSHLYAECQAAYGARS